MAVSVLAFLAGGIEEAAFLASEAAALRSSISLCMAESGTNPKPNLFSPRILTKPWIFTYLMDS